GVSGSEGALAVLDGVRVERERLAPLRARATRVIDTTNMSVHELRRVLVAHFRPASRGAPGMVTRFVSFGFKFGTPVDADVVLDVRFLDNPYFVPGLRALSGLDAPVVNYVLGSVETQEFLRHTRGLLEYVLPRYEREGKSYLTVAIGCTGGRHRSVAIAEALARGLTRAAGASIGVLHRDVHRGQLAPSPVSSLEPRQASSSADDDHSSVLELKGMTAPPPATTPREEKS